MIKNKQLMVVLMLFVLSATLFTASVMGQEGVAEPAANATASGVLKAVDVDAATVTIATANGEELVLKVNEQSKIQIAGAPSDLAQLATKIDSNLNVEYQPETKTLMAITIQ